MLRRFLVPGVLLTSLALVGSAAADDAGAADSGVPCGDAGACPSGVACIDGYCCNDPTCGDFACTACNGGDLDWPSPNGTCAKAPLDKRYAGRGPTPSCGPYLCNGIQQTCPSPVCASNAACADGYYCSPNRQCVRQLELGVECGNACAGVTGPCTACAKGYCVDGVCCDSACNGPCVACAGNPHAQNGTCSPVPPGTHDDACSIDRPCGTTESCDGNGKCALMDQGVSCLDIIAACDQTGWQFTCDGQGTCEAVCTGACDFKCAAERCSTTVGCAIMTTCDGGCDASPSADSAPGDDANGCHGSECADASACTGGACDASVGCSGSSCGGGSNGSECKDMHTVKLPDGGLKACADYYTCVDGACQQRCGSTYCSDPEVCLLDQMCGIANPSEPPMTSCSVPFARGGSATSHAWSWLSALAIAAWMRARRRDRSA